MHANSLTVAPQFAKATWTEDLLPEPSRQHFVSLANNKNPSLARKDTHAGGEICRLDRLAAKEVEAKGYSGFGESAAGLKTKSRRKKQFLQMLKKKRRNPLGLRLYYTLWCRRGDLNSHGETPTRP